MEKSTFLVLLIAVSAAFAVILWQFYGAILWSIAITVVFRPVERRILRKVKGHRNLAALLTLLLIIAIVILPATLVTITLLQEVSRVYARVQSGDINVGGWLENMRTSLPWWAAGVLERVGLADMSEIRDQLSTGVANRIQAIATQALNIGQGALSVLINLGLMLYLTFFLLRDGQRLTQRIGEAVPLPADTRELLYGKFLTVMRATMKGSFVVAVAQGTIGGLIFWGLGVHAPVLWGVLMAFLSLLPAVGAGFVWLPVAIYLLATGSVLQGVVLILLGIFVIGLVDNILRPILVGKDTRMPDFIVLISTLGGIALFGFNGVILGPLVAAMFIAVWQIMTHERENEGALPQEDPPASL
jgi:predicted PurR-regulated permease PerM